jgi:DNA polymerase I-like protein with 3'-5' exonuclease and polymerase domains
MRRPPPVTVIDFETMPIQPRPEYPPVPVGVSIKRPSDKKPHYFAWGHKNGGNNCSKTEAMLALGSVWKNDTLLFHHAQFDVAVAQTHMGCGPLPWERAHDTMFLMFLDDPHAEMGLKPAAERLLGVAPDERDAVADWLWSNKHLLPFEEYGVARSKLKVGAFTAWAPVDLAGPYADGDVTRTLALFNKVWPTVMDRGMGEAYDRERKLMPILLENERVGMRVDAQGLSRDIVVYDRCLVAADAWLRKRLKSPSLELTNDGQIAEALSRCGIIADEDWELTPTGKRSLKKGVLVPSMFKDARVASALGYRNRLQTCLTMFMLPWQRQLDARGDGHISTNWNQIRQERGGARTGRPSTSDPNFLNLSKTWDNKDDGYAHPTHLSSAELLPLVRKYILPDKGGVFLHRDYDGQELRIAAHFEDGPLLAAYAENPHLDVHDHVRQMIEDVAGLTYHRGQVKITNFRNIYGGGAPAVAAALHVDIGIAKELLAAHGRALPGLTELKKQIKALSNEGSPITTWGGREYYVEPPSYSKKFGRHMTYEYKLLNSLVQGSAADCTKEAIIRWHDHPQRDARFLVTVYDEINISASTKTHVHQMGVLRACMESIELDVPLLSAGKSGPNWASLTKFKESPYVAS